MTKRDDLYARYMKTADATTAHARECGTEPNGTCCEEGAATYQDFTALQDEYLKTLSQLPAQPPTGTSEGRVTGARAGRA